jgi:hypothetical protein
VKSLARWAVVYWLLAPVVFSAQAGFTSMYIFGDGVCTTTNNPNAGQYYYGLRRSNGRVWVEVLAQRQGLSADSITNANWSNSTNNWSYYGQFSPVLVTNLNNFNPPADANTALFVVWVCDADFVGDMGNIYPYYGTDITQWTNAIYQSLTNHWNIITNLYYADGARTLIMPNAVDITEIPQYSGIAISAPADQSFIRQQVMDFNAAFAVTLSNAMASLPGLTIYEPDMFSLLDNVLTNAAAYGLTNVLYDGYTMDAYEASGYGFPSASTNGYGTNFIFWDPSDPTAQFHEVIADVVQQLISPVKISKLKLLNSSNRVDVVNVPVGLNGFVDGRTNVVLGSWTPQGNINSTNATQTIFFPPAAGSLEFYRLRFPFAWTWP